MHTKVYQGTIDSLLKNDVFVSEFLQGIRNMDLSRLIDDGIYAKLFIADSSRKGLNRRTIPVGEEDYKTV
ncbi:MAG TPA: hypothetical protein VLX29_01980 [Nitrospirota bacterium]|nr:hypothetical protein [Nitrospirota bacterium]